MVIGVDIDGVLFPWEDAVADALERKFGLEPLGVMTSWDDYRDRVKPEAWDWLWTPEGSEAVLRQTWRTYPGAVEAVRALMEAGHSVHFATHRDPCMTSHWTADYLRRHFHGLRWEGLHVTRNTVAKRKLARWDVFVDDKPETVWDFLDCTTAQVFAPVRSWNVDELEEAHHLGGFVHYTDPATIAKWVLARG